MINSKVDDDKNLNSSVHEKMRRDISANFINTQHSISQSIKSQTDVDLEYEDELELNRAFQCFENIIQ